MKTLAALALLFFAAQETVVDMPLIGETEAEAEPQTEEERKRMNRRRDVNEFGAHERPWAYDAIKVVEEKGEIEQLPGLAQSADRVRTGLVGEPLRVPRALEVRAVDMAAAFDALGAEKARIDAAWAEIAEARAVAAVAQSRALQEIERLEKLRDEVEGLIGELEEKEDMRLAGIADLVSQMSAKKAAGLLEANDPQTVLSILSKLDDRQSAEILGRMDDKRGQELMVLLADQGKPAAGRTGAVR